jgi:hypothetical protein
MHVFIIISLMLIFSIRWEVILVMISTQIRWLNKGMKNEGKIGIKSNINPILWENFHSRLSYEQEKDQRLSTLFYGQKIDKYQLVKC